MLPYVGLFSEHFVHLKLKDALTQSVMMLTFVEALHSKMNCHLL